MLERAAPDELAAAHEQHRDLDGVGLAIQAQHVLIDEVVLDDVLARERALDRRERIAQRGGELEVLARRLRACMRPRKPLDELVGLAGEEHPHVADLLGVRLGRHGHRARARAALDLVLQARPAAGLEHVIGAGAQLEVAVERAQRLAARGRRVIGAEVVRAVVADVAHDLEAREQVALLGAFSPGFGSSSRSTRYFLSSRSLTLKRGWCFLIRWFSRSSASFADDTTIVSTSATVRASKPAATKKRSSPPSRKYWRTRLRRLCALPT